MVPAICDSCGSIFGSDNFIAGNLSTVTISGGKVGPCPNCSVGMGSIPDGVYDLQDDVLKVVSSSGIQPAALQSLIGWLEALKRGEASSAQVLNQVENQAPALAPTVRVALEKPDRAKWIAILISIIAFYLQATAAQPPTAREVAEELRAAPLPTYSVPAPKPAQHAAGSSRRRRSGKQFGKAKQSKSRKRR